MIKNQDFKISSQKGFHIVIGLILVQILLLKTSIAESITDEHSSFHWVQVISFESRESGLSRYVVFICLLHSGSNSHNLLLNPSRPFHEQHRHRTHLSHRVPRNLDYIFGYFYVPSKAQFETIFDSKQKLAHFTSGSSEEEKFYSVCSYSPVLDSNRLLGDSANESDDSFVQVGLRNLRNTLIKRNTELVFSNQYSANHETDGTGNTTYNFHLNFDDIYGFSGYTHEHNDFSIEVDLQKWLENTNTKDESFIKSLTYFNVTGEAVKLENPRVQYSFPGKKNYDLFTRFLKTKKPEKGNEEEPLSAKCWRWLKKLACLGNES